MTEYSLKVQVVDRVPEQGQTCQNCGEFRNEPIAAAIHFDNGTDCHVRHTCLTCVFPFIDSIPWLDLSIPIVVEVARGSTNRPF